jgi:hypothetical protein
MSRYVKLTHAKDDLIHKAIVIFKDACNLKWSYSEITDKLVDKIYKDDSYNKLPRYCKEYVDGYISALTDLQWEKVVFAYVVDGDVLDIESEEYEQIPPVVIATKYGDTGHFVYRDDKNKRYT